MARLNRKRSPLQLSITLPSGKSFDGKLEHIDDFNVVLITPDGEYHSFDRNGDSPKIEIHDPLQAHFDMLTKYTDEDIRNLTAYLETLQMNINRLLAICALAIPVAASGRGLDPALLLKPPTDAWPTYNGDYFRTSLQSR